MSFFLVDRGDMDALVQVRKELLDGVRPAITTVFVAGLVDPAWKVEVEAVAYRAVDPPRGAYERLSEYATLR